ncbi:MAG: hypothetical protein EAS48_09855 [Chryseobacterium sp.]|nr:MAG: hypothetical protein EAS48_09855 [Chryseobacterium sp.]
MDMDKGAYEAYEQLAKENANINLMDDLAANTEEIAASKGNSDKTDRRLNIIVAGKSGVGKSSLLNYLVDMEIFETGVGAPVTQEYFESFRYKHPTKDVEYVLFDTKGIEPDTTEEFATNINDEIKKCADSDNIFDHFHTLFYCLSASSKRIEPFEIDFINKIGSVIDVVVVLTKSDQISDAEYVEMAQVLREKIDASETDVASGVKIVRVCSVATTTRKGTFKQFGREDVLNHSLIGLWNTFASQIPDVLWDVVYNSIFCTLEIPIPQYNTENLHRRNQFLNRWRSYFDEKYNLSGEHVSLIHVLRLLSLEELGANDLKSYHRAMLVSLFELFLRMFADLTSLKEEFTALRNEIETSADAVIDFYKELMNTEAILTVPLINTRRRLTEIEHFICGEFREFIIEECMEMIAVIEQDRSEDGWFGRLGSSDTREFIREEYDDFRRAVDHAEDVLHQKIHNFAATCTTEISQFGVLKLKDQIR